MGEEGVKLGLTSAEVAALIATHAALAITHGAVDAIADQADIAVHAARNTLHPKLVLKTADQTLIQSSTTLQNVTEMLFAVGANEVWAGVILIRKFSGTVPDFKYAFAIPTAAAMVSTDILRASYKQAETDLTIVIPILTTTEAETINFLFLYIGGATAGNVQLQAAQNTADASDTKILANSFIIAYRLL